MKLRQHDLNLIPILETLLRRRNVTRASEELGLSQSATSHALMRLREQFGDQLLVPRGRKMTLTGRAQELLTPVGAAVAALEHLLETRRSFDASTSARCFKLGMADHVAALILPNLLGRLRTDAPGVSVQVIPWAKEDLAEKLHMHEVDLALLPRGSIDAVGLHEERLFIDDLVIIASPENREIGDKLDLETYQQLPHVRFRQNARSFEDAQESGHPVRRKDVLLVADFLSLPSIVAETHCIALTHRSIARQMQKVAKLRVLEPPFATDKVVIVCYWSDDSDAGIPWLRHVLREICPGFEDG